MVATETSCDVSIFDNQFSNALARGIDADPCCDNVIDLRHEPTCLHYDKHHYFIGGSGLSRRLEQRSHRRHPASGCAIFFSPGSAARPNSSARPFFAVVGDQFQFPLRIANPPPPAWWMSIRHGRRLLGKSADRLSGPAAKRRPADDRRRGREQSMADEFVGIFSRHVAHGAMKARDARPSVHLGRARNLALVPLASSAVLSIASSPRRHCLVR